MKRTFQPVSGRLDRRGRATTRDLLAAILTQCGARVTAVDGSAAAMAQLDIEVPGLEAALAAGFDDFLTKPALPLEVVRTVGRWLLPTPSGSQSRRRSPRARPLAEAADRRSAEHR
jgi:hypothetical protein